MGELLRMGFQPRPQGMAARLCARGKEASGPHRAAGSFFGRLGRYWRAGTGAAGSKRSAALFMQ